MMYRRSLKVSCRLDLFLIPKIRYRVQGWSFFVRWDELARRKADDCNCRRQMTKDLPNILAIIIMSR